MTGRVHASAYVPSRTGVAASFSARKWLFEEAIPFWAERGIDRVFGGFFESVNLNGTHRPTPFKRTRLTARQTYVFCHASSLGMKNMEPLAEHGIRFLLERHAGETPGSWRRRLDATAEPLDDTSDLYDTAFALFALAWWHRLSGDPKAVDVAVETLSALSRTFPHPSGRGYAHEAGNHAVHHQNPLMHLVEALVELHDATGRALFLDHARPIVELFRSSLFSDGVLREFFADDWSPASGEPGRHVEPGHMAEWAWILARYGRLSGENQSALITALMNFVLRSRSHRADGLLVDVVREDGSVHKSSTRLWPQTELIKGLIALSETTGEDRSDDLSRVCDAMFARFIDQAPSGCWVDHRDADDRPIVDAVPASSLYHLMLGITEYSRFDAAPTARLSLVS